MRDLVGLSLAVFESGMGALVPGSGFGIAIAKKALSPEINRLQEWSDNKRRQRDFAKAVQLFALQEGIGDDDRDDGLTAANSILQQKGASLLSIAENGLDAERIARAVLAGDPHPQRNLNDYSSEVCRFAVAEFYRRFLRDNDEELRQSIDRVQLSRMEQTLLKINEVWDVLSELELPKTPATQSSMRSLFIYLEDKRMLRCGYKGESGIKNLDDLACRIDSIRNELFRAKEQVEQDREVGELLVKLQDACHELLTRVYSRMNADDARDESDVVLAVEELRCTFREIALKVHQTYGLVEAKSLADKIDETFPRVVV